MKDEHAQFSGSIPAAYDRYLGSMLFQPYAEDLAARLQVAKNGSVLELACGTGIFNARFTDWSTFDSETDRDGFERTDVSACGGQVS